MSLYTSFLDSASNMTRQQLIVTLEDNCQAAEQMALETVTANDLPFFGFFRDLTKGECWQILRKHQDIFNTLEQALILNGLTDYITCASKNELFDTFRKKVDRDGLPALLLHLNTKWMKFFRKLGQYDLTYAQLNSTLFLLRQSLRRLPENHQKLFFSDTLQLGETCLEKARMSYQYHSLLSYTEKMTQNYVNMNDLEIKNRKETVVNSVSKSHCKKQNNFGKTIKDAGTAVGLNETKSGTLNLSVKSNLDLKQKGAMAMPYIKTNCQAGVTCKRDDTSNSKNILNTVKNEESTSIQSQPISSLPVHDKKQRIWVKTKENLNCSSKDEITIIDVNNTNNETGDKSRKNGTCNLKRNLDNNTTPTENLSKLLYESMKTSNKTGQQRKYTYDITKYILRSCENKVTEQLTNISDSFLRECKENMNRKTEPMSPLGGNDLVKLKAPDTHTTPTGKSSVSIDLVSPTKKPRTEDNNVKVGRLNAFEIMMRQSRANKGQSIKRKSLFQ